jgi:alkylation response protein AidB-like acyl-CoA dehydrogenase
VATRSAEPPDEIRTAARDWFARHWNPDRPLGEWWDLLTRSGWGFPTWPADCYGRDLTPALAGIVEEERRRAGAAAPPQTLGAKAVAPMLVRWASPAQRERYLLPTLAGQTGWCELFSEPGAGSDLAGLATRARRDGDEWVVNGQKLWSSGAPVARWGLLAVRTDPAAPKRQGITCFALDMGRPGIDVRPLRTMTGEYKFSEVFLDDVPVLDADRIGEPGQGWTIVKETLALERQVMGPGGPGAGSGGMADNNRLPPLDRPAGVVAAEERAGRQRGAMVTGAGGLALVQRLLEDAGGHADPLGRQQIARLYTLQRVARATAAQSRGPQAGSVVKLLTGRSTLALRDLANSLEGPAATLAAPDAPLNGVVQRLTLTSPSMAIMAGTDEIQKNLIAERALGPPPEPGP